MINFVRRLARKFLDVDLDIAEARRTQAFGDRLHSRLEALEVEVDDRVGRVEDRQETLHGKFVDLRVGVVRIRNAVDSMARAWEDE